ncbi:UV DNA damage repair endonuclease UvsE [Haloplanus sp.]|uniref:UV DNA damage repair endonuclease UvsE n=1 Tax=Haloplanus sp. TaxID=1961696 RepID=UPI002629EDEA|nr:UV DNA damage repair endonuclease UvsE [Haloplanus sp.]
MLGYPGMNHTLRDRDPPVRCNRSMRKATFEERGLSYASELALQNMRDLHTVLEWNTDNGIRFYRCPSKLVPWNSQFELEALPDYEALREAARRCGAVIEDHDMRLTFHPDYWCRLASDDAETRASSITAIEYHADWFELLGLDATPYYGINVHIGATYGDKEATAERFRAAIDDLSVRARKHLTVENDDTSGLWGVPELVDAVEGTGVPVLFDYHHHSFTDRELTYREGFELAAETWGEVRPATHYSEPACLRNEATRPQAHAEYVADLPAWLRRRSDVVIEAGGKEDAVARVR